jgi:hypothetical protein
VGANAWGRTATIQEDNRRSWAEGIFFAAGGRRRDACTRQKQDLVPAVVVDGFILPQTARKIMLHGNKNSKCDRRASVPLFRLEPLGEACMQTI